MFIPQSGKVHLSLLLSHYYYAVCRFAILTVPQSPPEVLLISLALYGLLLPSSPNVYLPRLTYLPGKSGYQLLFVLQSARHRHMADRAASRDIGLCYFENLRIPSTRLTRADNDLPELILTKQHYETRTQRHRSGNFYHGQRKECVTTNFFLRYRVKWIHQFSAV